MSKADELRADFEAQIKIAELEDELVRLKEAVKAGDPHARDDSGDKAELRRVKNELRDARRASRIARDGAAAPVEAEGGE